MDNFNQLVEDLGVPLVDEKVEGPSTMMVFLGIKLDSVKQESRLLRDKVQTFRAAMKECALAGKVTLSQLQRLVGQLNFEVCLIPMERVFSRRLAKATM